MPPGQLHNFLEFPDPGVAKMLIGQAIERNAGEHDIDIGEAWSWFLESVYQGRFLPTDGTTGKFKLGFGTFGASVLPLGDDSVRG